MRRLFAYGTLGIPEIAQALTGRFWPAERAVLEGFARYRVRGESFPGIVSAPGARTAGVLYAGVDARSLVLLDRFEGKLYERREVWVCAGEGTRIAALTYVVGPRCRRRLGREPWDRRRFEARHLGAYLAHCAQLRRAARRLRS